MQSRPDGRNRPTCPFGTDPVAYFHGALAWVRDGRTRTCVSAFRSLAWPRAGKPAHIAQKRARWDALLMLAANAEAFDDVLVAGVILGLGIVQQLAALRDHLQQTTT